MASAWPRRPASRDRGEPQLPATPENGIVRLTIKTDNPQVQLKRKVATVMTSATTGLLIEELVCRAPCGVVVDGRKGEEFYFGGKDFIPSEPFQLITHSGNLEATVKEGNHLAYTLGGGFLVARTSSGPLRACRGRDQRCEVGPDPRRRRRGCPHQRRLLLPGREPDQSRVSSPSQRTDQLNVARRGRRRIFA